MPCGTLTLSLTTNMNMYPADEMAASYLLDLAHESITDNDLWEIHNEVKEGVYEGKIGDMYWNFEIHD